MNKGQTFSWQKKSYSTYWNSPVDFSIQDLLAMSLYCLQALLQSSASRKAQKKKKKKVCCVRIRFPNF